MNTENETPEKPKYKRPTPCPITGHVFYSWSPTSVGLKEKSPLVKISKRL